MPCNCYGVRVNKCSCKLATSYKNSFNTNDDNACCLRSSFTKTKHNTFVQIAEFLYEKCASYNLRYCRFQSYSSNGSVARSLKNVLVVACFLVANSIVFSIIVFRTILDLSYLVIKFLNWAEGSFRKKLDVDHADQMPSNFLESL